jgi:ABC-2 type transport system permease protein
MNTRILGLLRKEMLQTLRDRVVLILVLYMYTLDTVTCTLALTFEVKHLPFGVVDQDRSVTSRALTQRFALNEAFTFARQSDQPDAVRGWLERGEVGMALVIPPGFERSYAAGQRPALQALFDGTYSNTAQNALHYVEHIVAGFEEEQASLRPRIGASTSASAMPRVWYNPDQSTKTFMSLSMIALAGMLVGAILPAATIVREKERGTIEQLLVTPVRIHELFLAKTLPTLLINAIAIFPALMIAALLGVPFRGSLATLLLMAAIFQISAVAFGVLVASVTRTLQQALLLAFFGLMPIMFLSGTLTPIESMPVFMQALSRASPLRYYMEILQGVFLKGVGWTELWPQALVLLAIGAALFAAAAAVFRRRLA